ncbi:ribonuclease [Qipengyuania sp.]|uniref:ribonuclease n=1 Tax=Qipengyuania sp. TaxID=2004515 RepID=UPI0035C7EE28
MAEWLVEEGIGESRAVYVHSERILAACLEWHGQVQPGWVVDARLASRAGGSPRGTVLVDGEEVLVDRLPTSAAEGAVIRIAITRAAFAGPGRFKRAQGRPSEAQLARPSLTERLAATGTPSKTVRRFPVSGWDELVDEALTGTVAFSGGTLWLTPTPALTAIDIDGDLPPARLAMAAVPALADALRRFDIGGSVAVDFPTLEAKMDRRAVDELLARHLDGWPHERTAMNGFGLVQIVARATRPSLLQRASWQRGGLVWRRLLRRAEALEGPGIVELAIAPALRAQVVQAHIEELERRTGRRVRLIDTPALAFDAPHAQLVSDDRHAP